MVTTVSQTRGALWLLLLSLALGRYPAPAAENASTVATPLAQLRELAASGQRLIYRIGLEGTVLWVDPLEVLGFLPVPTPTPTLETDTAPDSTASNAPETKRRPVLDWGVAREIRPGAESTSVPLPIPTSFPSPARSPPNSSRTIRFPVRHNGFIWAARSSTNATANSSSSMAGADGA